MLRVTNSAFHFYKPIEATLFYFARGGIFSEISLKAVHNVPRYKIFIIKSRIQVDYNKVHVHRQSLFLSHGYGYV